MSNKKIAGLITAAGMSSRMGAFKPLLRLGDKTIIEHAVNNLTEGGVEEITIVTGNRAEEVEKQIRSSKVQFIRNKNYETTSMFDSIKLGLQYIQNRCDVFYFSPADIPLFRGPSLKSMYNEMERTNCQVVQPMYRGKHGHPVLFTVDCIPHFLEHNGTNGLKGAMEGLRGKKVDLSLPDKGILMDADNQDDYNNLNNYFLNLEKPTPETCMEILKYFKIDKVTLEHCITVSRLAKEFAVKLINLGYELDIELIEASAMLHDIAKREKRHAECGAKWLRELGYPRIADIIGVHMDLPQDAVASLDERTIVYLADKFCIGNRKVSLEERFEKALSRYGQSEEALRAVYMRMDNAKQILRNIEEELGVNI